MALDHEGAKSEPKLLLLDFKPQLPPPQVGALKIQMCFTFLSVISSVQIKHSLPGLSSQTPAPFYQNQAHLPFSSLPPLFAALAILRSQPLGT